MAMLYRLVLQPMGVAAGRMLHAVKLSLLILPAELPVAPMPWPIAIG